MNNSPNATQQNAWTPQHQDLYDALIAERILPNFCRRISQEHTTIDRVKARAWRAWARSLVSDPGWVQIEAVLELTNAWPQTWQSLPSNAWSAQTDHFNALFFASLIPGALAKNNFDHALYAFQEALAAANRALQSTPSVTTAANAPETAFIYDIFTQPPFQDLDQLFKITTAHPDDDTNKLAKFTWQALLHAKSATLCDALKPAAIQANTSIENILEHMYADVQELIHTIDVTSATPEEFHTLFKRIVSFQSRIQPRAKNFYPIFEYVTVAATNTIATNIALANRADNFEILQPIIKLVQPLNEVLQQEIEADTTITQNFRETCAEFLALQGALEGNATKRLAYFERAIEIDPENPGAAIRAAQTCLERANTLLLLTAAVPGFAAQMPGGQRLRTRVEQARDLFFRACTLDPTNDLLPTYRTEIALECKRFDIPFEQNPEQTPDDKSPQDHTHET